MNDIEIGEYVRINQGKFLGIGKVIRKVGNTIYIKMNISLPISFPEDEIKKYRHSKNIIDLIEIGDYVNGYKVLDIADSIYKNSKRILIYKKEKERYERWIYIQEYDGKIHTQDDIKSILTKEKFKEGEYIFNEC